MPILLRIDCFSLFCFPNRITAEKDMHTFNAILKAFVSFRKLLRYRDNNLCISSLCQIYFKYNFCKYFIWKRYFKLASKKRAFEGFLVKDILKKDYLQNLVATNALLQFFLLFVISFRKLDTRTTIFVSALCQIYVKCNFCKYFI